MKHEALEPDQSSVVLAGILGVDMGRYRVWCEDLGQKPCDGKTFAEAGPCEAAQAWAHWNDAYSAEYAIIGGREMIATVEHLDNGDRTRWVVTGEAVPEYRARPLPANRLT